MVEGNGKGGGGGDYRSSIVEPQKKKKKYLQCKYIDTRLRQIKPSRFRDKPHAIGRTGAVYITSILHILCKKCTKYLSAVRLFVLILDAKLKH
jgi:hypothetical protein